VCVPNAYGRKIQQNYTKLAGYLHFLGSQKLLFYPQNPALAYPFTYPLSQSSDIFYQQFKCIIVNKNIFVKVKNIFSLSSPNELGETKTIDKSL